MNIKSNTIFHSLSKEDAAAAVETDIAKGLSEDEAANRLKQFGKNSLEEKKKKSPFLIFLSQFKSPIVFLLLFAAIFSFWFKEWLDGIAVLVVIIINSIIGFYMEYKAERSMQAIKKMTAINAKVLRNNQLREINSEDVVVGDIVFVEGGDLVPADGRVFNLSQLHVDESTLTGESLPVEKQENPIAAETQLAERSNMLYKGTYINKGNAHMIVTGTGMTTELGHVADLVQSTEQSVTPLEKKLQGFSKKLIKVTLLLVVMIFIVGLLNGQKLIRMLKTCISLAVAAIPEGLPIVATIALAQGMIKMAKQNIIIKKLSSVETLGGTTMICTDKTGTLTKNEIEVKSIFPSSKYGEEVIKNASILCNTAQLQKEGEELKELGDPLEVGILKYFSKDGLDVGAYRNKYPKIHEESFSSETKIMATLHKTEQGCVVYAKGAIEELLQKCNRILHDSGEHNLDEEGRKYWLNEAEKQASSGMRVIAVAYRAGGQEEKNLSIDLIFTGLIGMVDPPRDEVFAAIEECHSAGINIIMITGDHPSTAITIARQLNIIDEKESTAIVGKNMKDFDHLSEEDKTIWANSHVFARVSPKQKLDIVRVLQEKKFTIAMTGDGVNDAPALKKSDIGIAMGKRGTQVAQEVAEMIIKDDSFTAIALAVKQGRIIFENIRKCVIFLLSCNLSELFVISIAAVFNLPFQLFTLQILFMNIITDVLPALALGIVEGNPNIMKQAPRNMEEPILDRKRWWTIIFYSSVMSAASIGAVLWNHYFIHKEEAWSSECGNNILFFTLIFCQLLHVLNMGNTGTSFFKSEVFRNKYIWYSIAVSVVVLVVVYFIDPVSKALSVHSLSVQDWILCAVASIVSLVIIQMAKTLKIVRQ